MAAPSTAVVLVELADRVEQLAQELAGLETDAIAPRLTQFIAQSKWDQLGREPTRDDLLQMAAVSVLSLAIADGANRCN